MANAWPDDLWSLLGIAPPANDPPGFRVGNDAPQDTQFNNFGLTFPGLIPAFTASSPDAIGFNEEPAPPIDNVSQYPNADGPFSDGVTPSYPYPSLPSFPPLPTPETTSAEQQNWTWALPLPVPSFNIVAPVAPAPSFPPPPPFVHQNWSSTLGYSAFGGGLPSASVTSPPLLRIAPPPPSVGDGAGDTSPDIGIPGLKVASPSDAPGFHLPTNAGALNGPSNATNFTFTTHDAPANARSPRLAPSNSGLYARGLEAYPAITPAVLSGSPAVPAQEPFDAHVDSRLLPAINLGVDPQYIIPVQNRPPPGPRHNGGPPLQPVTPAPLPTQPSRSGFPQGLPTPSTPPPNATAPATGAAAAGTPAPAQNNQLAPADPDLIEKLAAWNQIARTRDQPSVNDQYLGKGGIRTHVGVWLNPRLGLPAAGRTYFPFYNHLLNGYRGELHLANRVAAALPKEVVIHFGMPAGRQGPDIISISPSGMISVWDSKWRSGNRQISPREGAHQTEKSLDTLQWEIRRAINEAVKSGRLSPDIAERARENLNAGNFDIYTIGTGNAHAGIVQSVRNGEVVGTWRP